MTDGKLKELVHMLIIRTGESKLHWARTGPESKFGITFNKSSITVESWINQGKKYVNFSIYNKDGTKIDDFKFNDQTEAPLYELVSKLHAVIESKFLESDITVDMILDELK